MRNRALVSAGAGIALGAALWGCSGPHTQPVLPFGDVGGQSTSRATQAASRHGGWMAAKIAKETLLYVSDDNTGDVDVYSYARRKLVGQLTGFSDPDGICVDQSGDVFVPDSVADVIVEYAHGGTTPIERLIDSDEPISCSVDPVNGNLAVVDGGPTVSIYPNAQGSPTLYSDPNLDEMDSAGYDGSGNLFVDGYSDGSTTEVDELPSGSSTFTRIDLNATLGIPGDVHWDGQHVDINDELPQPQVIDQFTISGSSGQLAAQTPLRAADVVYYYWIEGSKVVAADNGYAEVWFYNYPAGGDPTALISGFSSPIGITVSKGK
jgi:hypothetical protein